MPSPLIQDLMNFLDNSVSVYHSIEECSSRLQKAAVQSLDERDSWSLQRGSSYLVKRNNSSCIACKLPKRPPQSLKILAAHSDQPGLRLKPLAEIQKGNLSFLSLEAYGSPILSTWLNRDLGLAGRIFYRSQNDQIKERLIRKEESALFIPCLSLHLQDKNASFQKEEELKALIGFHKESAPSFLQSLLPREAKELLAHELFLYPLSPSRIMGEEDFLLSSRIDNLAGAHACLSAFLQSDPPDDELHIFCLWNHEEIGSQSSQGASSSFFDDVFERILLSYKSSREELLRLKQKALCLSVDMAHAFSPSHAQRFEEQHRPHLGQGPALKVHAQGSYASDGPGIALLQSLSEDKNPLQFFINRNDLPSGRTLGPLFSTQSGIRTLDLGCPQLSMHASRELLSCSDHIKMKDKLLSFLNRKI